VVRLVVTGGSLTRRPKRSFRCRYIADGRCKIAGKCDTYAKSIQIM